MSKPYDETLRSGATVEIPITWVLPHPTNADRVLLWVPVAGAASGIRGMVDGREHLAPLGPPDPALVEAADRAIHQAEASRTRQKHIGEAMKAVHGGERIMAPTLLGRPPADPSPADKAKTDDMLRKLGVEPG